MKKVLLYVGIAIAAITALALLGPMLGLAISALLVYGGIHLYTNNESTSMKVLSIVLVLIGVTSALSNVPGLIGILALAGVYYFYKKSKGEVVELDLPKNDDPFTNFEREWANLNK